MKSRRGDRQPDRKTLRQQAKQGAAVMWCTACDHFWREWADPQRGWTKISVRGDIIGAPPGDNGCPKCGEIYVVWENYPEWSKLCD